MEKVKSLGIFGNPEKSCENAVGDKISYFLLIFNDIWAYSTSIHHLFTKYENFPY